MTTTRAPDFGVTDLGRAEIAYQVQQAGNWRRTAGKSDAQVLATEYRRTGKIMRELLATPDRIEITSQVVTDYMRVLTALSLARAIDAGADTRPDHEPTPAAGIIRDAYGDLANGYPRKRDCWPLYAPCTVCGEITELPARGAIWSHRKMGI